MPFRFLAMEGIYALLMRSATDLDIAIGTFMFVTSWDRFVHRL